VSIYRGPRRPSGSAPSVPARQAAIGEKSPKNLGAEVLSGLESGVGMVMIMHTIASTLQGLSSI
jgi:hypothetical protein